MIKTAWVAPDTYVVGQLLTAASMNKLSGNFTAGFSVGSKQFVAAVSAGNATESQWQGGWLECNGALISRTTYASLFTYLNGLSTPLPYGSGNGSTTFTLPDYQGRMPVHHSISGPAAVSTLGNNDGQANTNRRPQHRTTDGKTVSAGSLGVASHAHSVPGSVPWRNNAGTGDFGPATAFADSTSPGWSQINVGSTAPAITGSPTLGGTIGSNVANDAADAPSYLVGGLWVIKF